MSKSSKLKPRGKPFEKGNKKGQGNGRPKTSPEEKKLSRLTRNKFNTIVRTYLDLNREELKKVATNTKTPALDLMVVSVMNRAITTGDEKKMNWFLEQLFGRLKENKKIELSGSLDSRSSIDLKKLSKEELEALQAMVEK